MRCRDLFGYSLRGVRKIAESSEEGSSNLIDLDSTSGLRRTSYLRIPAAKRNYVSQSFLQTQFRKTGMLIRDEGQAANDIYDPTR